MQMGALAAVMAEMIRGERADVERRPETVAEAATAPDSREQQAANPARGALAVRMKRMLEQDRGQA